MRFFTSEDSIQGYIAAVYQTNLCRVFELLKDNLEREIWMASGSLVNLGSTVIVWYGC
jgi:hypothetical protein